MFHDPDVRVKFFAAIAMSRSGYIGAPTRRMELLRKNNDRSRIVRHAAEVLAARGGTMFHRMLKASRDTVNGGCELGIMLALRRLKRAEMCRSP